ncbi:MAG TPA: cob(I)yrinic acid a,c-diamide adenosyltransferase [Bacillales bacterium]|nr:cob(I)yrinic acid a,c-diamide adenosyltransferase [Bacillales bacterium]
MKIYTKSGDKGTTSLLYGKRVPKSDVRVEAYGTCDETNSMIGVALSRIPEQAFPERKQFLDVFHQVQTLLFHAGAELSTPSGKKVHWPINDDHLAFLETWIDAWSEELPPLKKFILPGGTEAAASLHAARTVARRAERKATEIREEINPLVLSFLNRLSDFLFVAARYVNVKTGESETVLHEEPAEGH